MGAVDRAKLGAGFGVRGRGKDEGGGEKCDAFRGEERGEGQGETRVRGGGARLGQAWE